MALDLSPIYDSSFGGVSFLELVQDAFTFPGADLSEEFALLHIPGGNTSVLQSFGFQAQQLDLSIAINGSTVASLVAKAGTSGTLVYHGGSISARLTGITQPRKDVLGGGTWNMTLKFVKLS